LQAPDADEKVVYHFVAFVHKDGSLYELGKLNCTATGDEAQSSSNCGWAAGIQFLGSLVSLAQPLASLFSL
jgi:hypothetical protein